jgi:hypothetical protein
VYKKIRKTHIIAGLLELPQPGREGKLLLELPDGVRAAQEGLYYRTCVPAV